MFLRAKKSVVKQYRNLAADIKGEGDLAVHGVLYGTIEVDYLHVGRKGYIQGDIRADTLRVQGFVKGEIHARTVILEPGAHVEGELFYENLSVAPHCNIVAKLTPRPMPKVMEKRLSVHQVLSNLSSVA